LIRGGSTHFPDLQITVEDQLAEGDKVPTRWKARGTHDGEFAGIPPTGKQGMVTGTTISRIAAGKIVEERSNWNTLGLLQPLGVVPPMGEDGE
jgi:predicted ester cyclase